MNAVFFFVIPAIMIGAFLVLGFLVFLLLIAVVAFVDWIVRLGGDRRLKRFLNDKS